MNKLTITPEQIIEGLPTNMEYPNYYHESRVISAMQSYSDQQNEELRERVKELEKEVNDMTEFIPIYEGKIHKERCRADDAENRVKDLEAKLSQIADIDQEDDTAWERMKEIRADDYDLKTEREEEIFQFAFFEGIRYIQKALKK